MMALPFPLRGFVASLLVLGLAGPLFSANSTPSVYFQHGVELYQAARYSDAVEQFDQAIRHKDHADEAQSYIERIRKETVERIRNRALTGVNKANWQTKYYYMLVFDGRVRVGISAQEIFERDSLNFRPGAVDALYQLSQSLQKASNTTVDIDLVNELRQEVVSNPELVAQQLAAVYSYLSLAARDLLPKY
ncbi:MAG: hypothetical protein WC859_08360 [Elusimicrobiota bacterium]|jgi:hypothetical protein